MGFGFVLADLLVDLVGYACEARILCASCSIRKPQFRDLVWIRLVFGVELSGSREGASQGSAFGRSSSGSEGFSVRG